ncbi:MAG: toll/interleukin-1 receptor domain-containing protein [Ginsengibacter sp.]
MILEKIFFSYSRIDASEFVLKLALDLKKKGFNVWLDQEDIRAGAEWDMEIQKALENCDCLLFVETENSVNSNNVLDEVYYALEERKKVIPLILRDSKTPFRLQRLQHIDFTKDYISGLALLTNELKGDTAAEAFLPEEEKPLMKADKPSNKKYSRLLFLIIPLVIIIAVAIIYSSKNKKPTAIKKDTIVNSMDTNSGDRKSPDVEPALTLKKDSPYIEGTKTESSNKKAGKTGNEKVTATGTEKINTTDNITANLNETFAGDWKLADVEPKAQSTNGYLKIEPIDEKKVAIKSYVQFYYFKTNETSFLSVFNAFAGCTSCLLQRDMKITAEDVAIASQTYKILKEDEPGDGKAGDTIMNAGANKSIRATVTLQLINPTTAIIKIRQSAATPLSYGLVLPPFVYSFRFTKVE